MDREKLVPQMTVYDEIFLKAQPYLMFFNTPNFYSAVCNTDSYGFRVSSNHTTSVDYKLFSKTVGNKSVVLGNSTVFGIGASADNNTVVSYLNNDMEELFFNAGGRAFNSTQEMILYNLYFSPIRDIKRVIVVSGVNNLHLWLNAYAYPPLLGSFFFNRQYMERVEHFLGTDVISGRNSLKKNFFLVKRKILKLLLGTPRIAPPCVSTLDRPITDLVDIFCRDICILKNICDVNKSDLYFFLQPFAPWTGKDLTDEEKYLFNYFTEISGGNDEYIEKMVACKKKYTEQVENVMTDNNICYYDLNKDFTGKQWYFVDRVHLTDTGYRQMAKVIRKVISVNEKNIV